MRKSRRAFLKLVAAGSAAALAGTTRRSAAAAALKKLAKHAAAPAAAPATVAGGVRAEIAKQKESTAKSLKIIRDYPLPAGSPMAFVFKPMKAARGRKAR